MEIKHVLCIDDDMEMIELVRAILARKHITVLAATSAKEGLKKARAGNLDLILLDIMLPDMAGEEVFRRLRTHETTHHIPIVIFSAMSTLMPELRAEGYLAKPFTPQHVLNTVGELLDS